MPWVKFISNFDWKSHPRRVTAYKAGMHLLVSQACRDEAVQRGKARDAARPENAPAAVSAPARAPVRVAPAGAPRIRRRKNAGG